MSELSKAVGGAGEYLLKAAAILEDRVVVGVDPAAGPDETSDPTIPADGEAKPKEWFGVDLPGFSLGMDLKALRAIDPEKRRHVLRKIDKATHVRLPGEDHDTHSFLMDGLRFMTDQQLFVARNRAKLVWRKGAALGYTGLDFEVWCHYNPKGASEGSRWMLLHQVINPGTTSAALLGRKAKGPFQDPEGGAKEESVTFSGVLPIPSQEQGG